MKFIYKNSPIFYRYVKRKGEVVNVYLHGWGANYKSLFFCADEIKAPSLFVDFPPFGQSDKNISGWTIFSYATMVVSLCERLGIKKINLVGHSFGGRVAILVSVFCPTRVNKLVLVDSAGMKPRRGVRYHYKIWRYRWRKRLGLDVSGCGSADYLSLNDAMKKTFKNIVSTHLDEFLEGVKAQTLIIFGRDDVETPPYMAKRLNKKIKNSKLVFLEGAGHFCFNDNRYLFLKYLREFLWEG